MNKLDKLEKIKEFVYLGVMIDNHRGQEAEINKRIENIARLYQRKNPKENYSVANQPTLSFGSESQVLTIVQNTD